MHVFGETGGVKNGDVFLIQDTSQHSKEPKSYMYLLAVVGFQCTRKFGVSSCRILGHRGGVIPPPLASPVPLAIRPMSLVFFSQKGKVDKIFDMAIFQRSLN